MDEDDLAELVDKVSNEFSLKRFQYVTDDARRAILIPALPHLSDLNKALADKKISMEFIEDSIRTILQNSIEVPEGNWPYSGRPAAPVDANAIKRSMSRHCPYLFWC